jgi:ribosomal-protein-alanine N-acetyltransferase
VIFDDAVVTARQTRAILERNAEQFATERHGLWLAFPKTDDERHDETMLIGFGGLWYFRDPPELELLYGVRDAQVKRGYGREIARAIVDYGFAGLGLREIRASTHPEHAASRQVLADLGFSVEQQRVVHGLDTVFYTRLAPR